MYYRPWQFKYFKTYCLILIQQKGWYDYDAKNIELKEIMRKRGKCNKETEKSINCILCSGDVNKRYAKQDKYLLALNKLLVLNLNIHQRFFLLFSSQTVL